MIPSPRKGHGDLIDSFQFTMETSRKEEIIIHLYHKLGMVEATRELQVLTYLTILPILLCIPIMCSNIDYSYQGVTGNNLPSKVAVKINKSMKLQNQHVNVT